MIRLEVNGTLRRRTRIHLVFFWIVGPWRTDRIAFSQEQATGVSLTHSIGEFKVSLGAIDGLLTIAIDFRGIRVYSTTMGLPTGDVEMPFHAEPIKGIVLNLVAKVSVS